MNVLVASYHPWTQDDFALWMPPSGVDKFITTNKDVLPIVAQAIKPDWIFFPHWSWPIPMSLFQHANEMAVFHCSDLPFGRGGTPLQNLLLRGIWFTKITAFRPVPEMDAGPVFAKRDFVIPREGSAEVIYRAISSVCFQMMTDLITKAPTPVPQTGTVYRFTRRTPADSEIPDGLAGRSLYDFVRMLDAPGYPKAYRMIDGRKREYSTKDVTPDGELISA